MKIIFICGSLEPGKDGVGDYTRRLAAEMQLRKIEVLIIAINDKFITQPIIEESQVFDNVSINTLRYKKNKIIAINWEAIRTRIDAFAPNTISFQFVIYGFHPKGLPFGLPTKLKSLFKDYATHMMFHELWIGMEDGASLKNNVYGYLQRKIINELLKKTCPKYITTHTQLYKWQLKQLGYEVTYLPLFSNIKNHGVGSRNPDEYNIILFGGIHACNAIEPAIEAYCKHAMQHKLKLHFMFLGRNGLFINAWIEALQRLDVKYTIYGEQIEVEVSKILNAAHVGIATTPRLLEGKSGVVQAYKSHDLIVDFVNTSWMVSNYSTEDLEFVHANSFDLFYKIIT